jgi:hypothetical protein
MQKLFVVCVGIASLAVLADPACAEKVAIHGKKTSYQILEACNKVGGQYWKERGQYGCINDGKGTAINCSSDGTCIGIVPGKRSIPVKPSTIFAPALPNSPNPASVPVVTGVAAPKEIGDVVSATPKPAPAGRGASGPMPGPAGLTSRRLQ